MKSMDFQEIRTHLRDELIPDKHEKGKYVCPLCNSGGGGSGSDGAFSIDHDGIHGKCFSCGFYGDIFDLEAAKTGLSLQEATRAVVARYDFQPTTVEQYFMNKVGSATQAAEEPEEAPATNFSSMLAARHSSLKGSEGEKYLHDRGLTDESLERFNLGFGKDQNGHPCIFMPHDRQGTYYTTRTIRDEMEPNHMKPTGVVSSILYNEAALWQQEPCFIVESQLCAISIMQEGGSAVALASTSGKTLLLKAVDKRRPSAMLILALDNDPVNKQGHRPGPETQESIAAALAERGIPFVELNIAGECKDPNELLQISPSLLHANIETAIRTATMIQEAAAEQERADYEAKTTAAAFADFEDFLDVTGKNPPISTGFSGLDRMLNGGLTTGLYIMGALSSLGKTSWMLNIADNIAAAGRDVLYFSLEMSKNELIAKSLSRLSFLSAGELCSDPSQALTTFEVLNSRGKLHFTEGQKVVLSEAIDRYRKGSGQHIWMFEGVGDFGVDEIAKVVANHVKITGRHPVVFVDYLQILAATDPHLTDKQNTDIAVRELKRMSRDHDIPVFAISSLNRMNYGESINMASFKESGAIEYGSDVLIGVQLAGIKDAKDKKEREKIADKAEGNPQVEIEVRVLKNRNGARGGSGLLLFEKKYNYFSEVPEGFSRSDTPTPFDDDEPEQQIFEL
jgi:replicative DNA helicase